ncbi:MAG: GAF domain-containing protein [Anaerolineae bacterium]|nr:GAF domain-containing protein [Anaerolineae bacterium]
MMNKPTTPKQEAIHPLWQKLTVELATIFDAHFVCATVAQEIAIHTGLKTVVGMSAMQGRYYDVWVYEDNGRLTQTRWNNDKSSFDSLIANGEAQYKDKFNLSPAELVSSELWQLPKDKILVSPLPLPGKADPLTPPGILCLIDPTDDCPIDLDNIESLISYITVYLDRAYLRQQVHRQHIEFSVVSDISFALTSTLSLQKIYQQLIDPVRRTLIVESISVGLIDQDTGDITFVDYLLGPMFEKLPTIRIKKGQGIAGWVAENQQPVIINDVYADKRFYANVDRDSGFQTNSMVCIPLQVEERTIGVLQAINKKSGDFNEHDLRLLQAIGGPLAAAIENARLHNDVIAEKRRVETILKNMSEGLLTVNPAGIITQANDALLTLLAQDLDNFIGEPANRKIRTRASSFDAFMANVINVDSDNPQLATDIFQDDGESVPVLLSGVPILDEDGELSETIFVFSDLGQIREVERMRDDFFHGIIHELRTPLATILMYARLLKEGKAQDPEKSDRFLGVIERESDRLQKMVRQMLQVAKLEARELQRSSEPVEFNPLFDEMLPPLADAATEQGLSFSQRIERDLPPVMGIKDTYYLIFKNLVDNAIKFTMSGTVRIDAYHKAGWIYVIVKDQGIGIPKASLPNLFGRFFRAQTAVERGIAGTGLGLYMVKESVEHYGGTIEVNSVEGKGSTFTVKLPIADV